MRHRMIPLALSVSAASGILVFAGCSSASRTHVDEGEGVVHRASTEDARAIRSAEPIKVDKATLYVQGLSCPLCATNIDIQLRRLTGVSAASVDLSKGLVHLTLDGPIRPSPSRISRAVTDAGFTLVKIDQN